MGRRISDKHHQALADGWRRSLVAVNWVLRGSASNARRLAVEIGLDPAKIFPERRLRFQQALEKLAPALSAAGTGGARDVRPDALDAWIEQHLLRRGPDLLIPENVRRASLARQRDTHRRSSHSEAGLHSARIEMPEASWKKLKSIQSHLGRGRQNEEAPSRKVTLGLALARVIDAYFEGLAATKPKKGNRRGDPAASGHADLLASLTPDSTRAEPV
jgi:hypothetical protein